MSSLFKVNGKQVIDPEGRHFADAVTPVTALLIAVAMNHRNHRPAIDGEQVVCSRCLHRLPDDAREPCVPRAPRCPETPDMFTETAAPAPAKKRAKAA